MIVFFNGEYQIIFTLSSESINIDNFMTKTSLFVDNLSLFCC